MAFAHASALPCLSYCEVHLHVLVCTASAHVGVSLYELECRHSKSQEQVFINLTQ